MSQVKLVLLVAFFISTFDNILFFRNVIKVYPFNLENVGFLISLFIVLFSFIVFLLIIVSTKYTTKLVLITVLIFSSFITYFMNTYNIIVDYTMIQNTVQTNINESLDLFTSSLVLYVVLLGIIPSYIVFRVKIEYKSFGAELWSKLTTIIFSLALIGLLIFIFSKFYTSFFREYKPLRFYTNPTYAVYSLGKYINLMINNQNIILKPLGVDANIKNNKSKKLSIMIVGEAVRADRFSLNGYDRQTNPLLEEENIINFANFSSCGTSTAVSVPCMFSQYSRSTYSHKKGLSSQNVLDVLNHTDNIDVLWRDNNSDSKSVALRVTYQDFRKPKINTICEGNECRDVGMLVGLQEYIDKSDKDNIFIVLHQMGNHGPAYFKRYPKEFEKFKPICKTNQLEKCSVEEINNAYDNSVLYTDYFLSEVIQLLKQNDSTYETAMIYMSDHGESLGEKGLYLHGLPYFMAPKTQTHIPALMWFGENTQRSLNIEQIKRNANNIYSHANLFHTILGLMNVETSVYKESLDILKNDSKKESK